MDRKKLYTVVKGYLLKEKRNTLLVIAFLGFITAALLVGNQLFENIQIADKQNAQAMEGRQHATYVHISEADFKKMENCPYVVQAGQGFAVGRADDGTVFEYIDTDFRKLSADIANKNIKHCIQGHWAEQENEVVVTENYMQQHQLKLGGQITVDLTAKDNKTGDVLFRMKGLPFTVTGVIENQTGFKDRKNGYISKKLADKIMKRQKIWVSVRVKFADEHKILETFEKLNTYMGYKNEGAETVNMRVNGKLADAVDGSGDLQRQNWIMNLIVWVVCAMVVYHIFYNRFYRKKRDFANLRKMGFQVRDLLKIVWLEFLVFLILGTACGVVLGAAANRAACGSLVALLADTYDGNQFVPSVLSWHSVWLAAAVLMGIFLPSIGMLGWRLYKEVPAEYMQKKRKNTRKGWLSVAILSLCAVLASLAGMRDNDSDDGVAYIKSYVPGSLQITMGSLTESMSGGKVPSISGQVVRELQESPAVEQVQDYMVNYDTDLFLCKEKQGLNQAGRYYEEIVGNEQEIDGKKQCLTNITLVTTSNMGLVTSAWKVGSRQVAVMDKGLADTLQLKIGDTVDLYDVQLIIEGSTSAGKHTQVKVIDLADPVVLSENHLGGNLMIVDPATANLFPGKQSRQVVNLWVKEGKEQIVINGFKNMPQYGAFSVHNASEQVQAYTELNRNQMAVQALFMLLLTVTGLIVYFNTVFINLMDRQDDFLIMHKIGIRRREMCILALRESIGYGGLSAAVAMIAQCIACVYRKAAFMQVFWIIDAAIVLSCLVFPVIIMHVLFRRILPSSI